MSQRPSPLPDTSVVDARAKLNLFLRVLGSRSDGFHEVESVVLPVSLADRLEIHASADPGVFRTLSLSLGVTGDRVLAHLVPRDETNLVLQAAGALASHAGVKGFADVILDKRIPVAGGLGGGSADAAATLRALNDLWDCDLEEEELRGVAAAVGSDTPALLLDGPALARGRGERVKPVALPSYRWTLATFQFGVSTAEAFRWWDEDGGPTGPDPAPLLEAAAAGDSRAMSGLLYNDLEGPVLRRVPAVAEKRERLLSEGAAVVIMCGSGPTLAVLHTSDQSRRIEGGIEVKSVGDVRT